MHGAVRHPTRVIAVVLSDRVLAAAVLFLVAVVAVLVAVYPWKKATR